MSFKDTNNTEENPLPNNEIKTILLNVYEKLTKPSTKEVGYELFLKLILKHLYNPPSIIYIISQLAEFIPPLPPKEKEPTLNLLSLIFFDPNSNPENPKKKTIYFQYLSLVLSIIQNIISDKNNSIFGLIANTFAEIVQNIMPTDINYALEEIDIEERKAYETLQGFCLYNMKQEEKVNRIVGSLCLTKLVENCPVVLQEKYMKLIWENIIHLIEMKNYTAKYELLNCLISLILGAENLFMPFANTTLYKVLDFLSEEDSNKRKLALNVIYTLIFYCKEEILPLKDHIVNFLKVLKTDKVKEVREVCLLILQIFNENEPKKKEKEKSIGAIINTKNKGNKNNLGKKENENKSKNKSRPKTGNKMKKNNKFFENNKKFEKNPFKDNSFDNTNYNKKPSNNINNANTTNINNNENPGDENIIKTNEFQKKLNNETNTVETNITGATSNQNKIKGKKSNNFVNEKMIIKPDPNKSIFKAVPNSAFFNQGNQNNKDIVVMAKKKSAKINEINKNNNIIKEENNEKNEIINQNQEIKNEYKKDINKKKPKEDLRYKNIFNNDDDNNFNKEINNNNKYENGEEDNIIINEESNNNINNIIDCDERPKQKNTYEKDNKYKKENVGNSNNNIIQKLLNQMDFLTKGQNSLEKMFNNIQLDTQEQIDNLNINYENLQIKTNKLNKDFDNFNLNVY
jgi:hypothetical protein